MVGAIHLLTDQDWKFANANPLPQTWQRRTMREP